MNSPGRASKKLIIRRADQLRAMRGPVRRQLLFALEALQEASIAELADQLQRSPESLAYHVKALEKAGLLKPCGVRSRGGRAGRTYQLVAAQVLVDPKQRSPRFLDALGDLYKASMRWAERALLRGLDADRGLPAEAPRQSGLLQVQVRVNQRGLTELRRKLLEVADELSQLDEPDGEMMQVVTIAFSPRPE